MRKLTKRQASLLEVVRDNPLLSTNKLNSIEGNREAYETNTRNRLFSLARKGLIRHVPVIAKTGRVIKRTWTAT